jgi:hypothetical protein
MRHTRTLALLVGVVCALPAAVAIAQQGAQGPVAAMFGADQKRDTSFAQSFLKTDLPATGTAAFAANVYLSAGDLERAFDKPEFRPDAAVVPTNTDLQLTSPVPATQRVLIDRVRKQPDAMRDLEEQVAARRKQPPAATGKEAGLLRIGVDTFVAQLRRGAGDAQSAAAFPKAACLVATDFANGGAVDRRELFAQDRLRKGIAACLTALDAAGAQSVVLPLTGAASSKVQANDALLEGQRALTECRLINSTAGIALGIHDFASSRRTLKEIGVVQWDQDIAAMFKVPEGSRAARSAQTAYRAYADKIGQAFRKGLAGEKTTPADVGGNCAAILNAQ